MELDLDEPDVVIAVILLEPVIDEEEGSPPGGVALVGFVDVDVPDWSGVDGWTDEPVDEKDRNIEGVESEQLVGEGFPQEGE